MKQLAVPVGALIAGGALALHAASGSLAQTPQFRSGIALVELDVSVLDKDRRPVRGLTKLDFMVLEDGKPQEIVSLAEIDVPEPVDVPTPWLREIPRDVKTNIAGADRLIVLVLDDAQVRMHPAMNKAVREVGRRVIDRLGPNDLAAVVFTRNNSDAQPFTADRARLLAAVEKFSAGFGGSTGPGDWSAEYFYKSSLFTLKYVAESMATADERRKAVIYVSPGLPLSAESSRASSALYSHADALFREAQRANVNIYSIDPSGLGALDNEDPALSALPADASGRVQTIANDFLHMLARNTGGLAIVNRNEFSTGVTQIFRENGSYYLIGYRSTNSTAPGKYRRIDVRVYRPGLIVRARNGYYGTRPEGATSPGDVSPSLRKALASVVPARDVAMQVTAAPFAIPGRKDSAVALVLALRQPAPPAPDRITERVDVLIGAYLPDGRRQGAWQLNAKVVFRPAPGGPIQYEVLSQLPLKPGRYQLRLAAESAMQGRSGSVYYDVEVPDFSKDQLTMSGIVLSAEPNVPSAPRDALAKLIPLVPTARRQFWATDRVEAFVRFYQGGRRPEAVAVRTQIRDWNDRTVFETNDAIGAAPFAKERSADHRVELPISNFARGSYVLTVEGVSNRASVRRDVRFVVQ